MVEMAACFFLLLLLIRLTNEDAPSHTLASLTPSGEIVEGSIVILSCSSDANPPAEKYTWYKRSESGMSEIAAQQIYTISNVSSEHTGDYFCQAVNRLGHANSTFLHLDVLYAPKNISASLTPSGKVMEGSSVILACSSDANPPVQSYTWYKRSESGMTSAQQVYSISRVSSEHTGDYYCQAENKLGHANSKVLYLDVLYAPKNTSASVSPSGEIVEGTSVNLTCSSDANPPVQSYTWYKSNRSGMLKISTQQIYSISNVSTEHTGDYYCQAENKHGCSNSTVLHLDVLYPPNWSSASRNHPDDLAEDSSVTLTCSSDANPPVENYTWYRRTGDKTTAVDSGETITITLTSTTAGLYHCEAKNKIGSQNSSVVHIYLAAGSGGQHMALTAGGTVSLLTTVLIVVMAIVMSRRRRKMVNLTSDSRNTDRETQDATDNDHATISLAPSDLVQSAESAEPDDGQYVNVQFKSSREEDVPLYSTLQMPQENAVVSETSEDCQKE